MLLFNFIVSCVAIWIILYSYNIYIRRALMNKERFKLFALRDNLSLLAMKGKISPDNQEYLTLLKLLNSSTKALGTFSLVKFLRSIILIHTNKEVQKELDTIMQSLNHKDDDYKKIVHEYFEISRIILYKHTRLFTMVIYHLLSFSSRIQRKLNQIKEVDSIFEERLKQTEIAA